MDLNRCLVFTADSSKPKFITSLLSDNNGRSFQMRQELFDKVLLDAPCSGLGKRPYIQRDLDIPKLGTFHGFQRKFVFNAVQLLKPGGVLVYSTCTTRDVRKLIIIGLIIAIILKLAFWHIHEFLLTVSKIYIDTNDNSLQISPIDCRYCPIDSFSSMLFGCRNLLLIAKKIAVLI